MPTLPTSGLTPGYSPVNGLPATTAVVDLLEWALSRHRDGGYDFERCATRELGKPHVEDIAAALVECSGSLADVSDLLHVGRARVHAFVNNHPDLRELIVQLRESIVDRVERSVHERALAGDWKAERFLLTTLGRDRGYGSRVVVEDERDAALRAVLDGSSRAHVLPGDLIDVTPSTPEEASDADDISAAGSGIQAEAEAGGTEAEVGDGPA